MSAFYFAYGSNMNPARMANRGMRYLHSQAAQLSGWRLQFNKRAADIPGAAYANIVVDPHSSVSGVLYRLADVAEIGRMDPFENWPERYRREQLEVVTAAQDVQLTWVYIANPHWQQDGLRPQRWYLNHLLSGRPWLPERYYRWLAATDCLS